MAGRREWESKSQRISGAVGGLDETRAVVAVGEFHLGGFAAGAELLDGVVVAAPRRAHHRDQFRHPVAAVDAHHLADRADGVGGIGVAEQPGADFAAPGERALGVEQQGQAVVDVSAFGVVEVAEHARSRHVVDLHSCARIDVVLQQHVARAGLLLGSYQVPAFLESAAGGHLRADVFAGVHCVERHHGVPIDGCGDEDGVEVVASEHSAVIVFIL